MIKSMFLMGVNLLKIVKHFPSHVPIHRLNAWFLFLDFLRDFPGLINIIPHYYVASYLSIAPETLSRIPKFNFSQFIIPPAINIEPSRA